MGIFDEIRKYVGWPATKQPGTLPTATGNPATLKPTVTITTVPPPPFDPNRVVPLSPLVSNNERSYIFGNFRYEADPMVGNEEHIRILDGWADVNIIWVPIPQLKGIPGVERQTGKFSMPPGMLFHKKAAQQLVAMWDDWEAAGLIPLVKSFEGSFAPRFVRGSSTNLSNHAFGNAFDINYDWNHLGATPAQEWQTGSVRRLVPIASQHGFFWGGNYQTRKDGMHFEVARIL